MSRILKTGDNQITQKYNIITHKGIDIVKYKSQLDYIIAHSDGEVVEVVKNYNRTDKSGGSYGNYVRIKHSNGYYTLYAHMAYGTVKLSKGQTVKKGQVLGYMGNTGHSFGAHVHFEVRNKSNIRINPAPYIDADLPNMNVKSVSYRVYSNNAKRWFDTTSNGKTAGNKKDKIGGIQVKGTNTGTIKYKVHVKGGKWLPEVKKWDDTDSGYAGIKGKPIDAITIWSEKGDATYRVYTKKSGWLPYIKGRYGTTNPNDYAGILDQEILAIQIKIK